MRRRAQQVIRADCPPAYLSINVAWLLLRCVLRAGSRSIPALAVAEQKENPMSNLRTAQEVYEAFGRGDLATILSKLSESVEWEYGGTSTNVPWLQRRQGRDGAAAFFASLDEMEIHTLAPKTFLETEGVVVVLLDVDLTVKATGERVVEEDEIHVWRFNAEGKVSRFRHGIDTHQHQLAYNK